MPLLLTVKRYRKFVERFVEWRKESLCLCDAPTVWPDGCQMKPLKTRWPLHVDYSACTVTVVEVI